MEWVVRLRDICIPMPPTWFIEHRKEIVAGAREIVLAKSKVTRAQPVSLDLAERRKEIVDGARGVVLAKGVYIHPVSLDLFEPMVSIYEALAASQALHATLRVACCTSHLTHCGVAVCQHALLVTMRRLAKGASARALFLEHMPVEMLREISRYLDVSSMRAWKRADPYVARLLVSPSPKINWKAIAQSCATHQSTLSEGAQEFFSLICEAAYTNDVADVQKRWLVRHEYLGERNYAIDPVRPVLIAIAMGNAADVWRLLQKITEDFCFDDMLNEAAGHGRVPFIRLTLCITTEALIKYLYNFDQPMSRGRFQKRTRHPVVQMACRQHFSYVTWFFDKVEANKWAIDTVKMKLIYNACAAYGHMGILERFPTWCDQGTLNYAIANGKTARGLRWMEEHHPTLFISRKSKKKKSVKGGTVKAAMKRGTPDVLQWLLDRGDLDLNDQTGHHLYLLSSSNAHARTLAWMERQVMRLDPMPAWYTKLQSPAK
jgi:hypothetical protein